MRLPACTVVTIGSCACILNTILTGLCVAIPLLWVEICPTYAEAHLLTMK